MFGVEILQGEVVVGNEGNIAQHMHTEDIPTNIFNSFKGAEPSEPHSMLNSKH
jgi:hypothetical protein